VLFFTNEKCNEMVRWISLINKLFSFFGPPCKYRYRCIYRHILAVMPVPLSCVKLSMLMPYTCVKMAFDGNTSTLTGYGHIDTVMTFLAKSSRWLSV